MATTLREIFQRRHAAYQDCFLGPNKTDPHRAARIVIADLRRFCRARTSTATVSHGRIDPIAMALAEGRREVYNRIVQYVHLDDRQIQAIGEEDTA